MEKQASPSPQVIASRKDQVRANLINLTRLNFSPLKLLHYFYVIPRSPVNTRDHRYFQLGPNNVVHQRRYTILLIPSNEFHRANLRFHSSFHSNSQSLQDIVALIPDKNIFIVPNVVDRKTLMPRNKQTIFFESRTKLDHETRRKSKNIGSTKGLETKLSLRILLFLPKETTGSWARFSDRFRGVSGQLAGRSHPGEGERRRSEKPSNRSFSLHPGWKPGWFLQRPGTAEVSLLKGCRWSFDFSRLEPKGKF